MFAPTLLLAIVCSAPPVDGEQVLQDVDKKIMAAKTLRIEFEVVAENGGLTNIIASGVVRIAEKNRFRTDIDFHNDPKRGHEVTICDGKTAVRRVGPSPAELKETERRAVPSWYTAALLERLGRGGTFAVMEVVWQEAKDATAKGPGAELTFKTDKIALDPATEKVKDAECSMVDYELSLGGAAPLVKARVWVDRKSGLPMKRRMDINGNILTATHSVFAVDEKMEEKVFAVGK